MSLWKIAWRSIQQRALASGLTAFSIGLGVALVVAVLVIHSVVAQSFRRGSQGYDLIVGAKGSQLQLVLNSVFYLGEPIENIPYEVYEEFTIGRHRAAVTTVVPICMGHAYQGLPVVATTPDMFKKLTYLEDRKYEFPEGQGRNFKRENSFEAVVGWTAAREANLKIGSKFSPVGAAESVEEAGHEDLPFEVVGILAPTGTPNDRALFVNMEGFFECPAHAAAPSTVKRSLQKPDQREDSPAKDEQDHDGHDHAAEDEQAHGHDDAHEHPAADEPAHDHEHEHHREVTALLVVTDIEENPQLAMMLPEVINEGTAAQAARPAIVITGLFEGIVGNVQLMLLVLAVLVVVVAGIGILVSIYNSMSDRRHDIAIMRALGARRSTVMAVILVESILLALGGGLMGVLLGHGLVAALGPTIAEQTRVIVHAWQFQLAELILIPGLVVLATIVGYLPALAAYKTDVARSLTATG
jgi:putative ABC transport system permease protein